MARIVYPEEIIVRKVQELEERVSELEARLERVKQPMKTEYLPCGCLKTPYYGELWGGKG